MPNDNENLESQENKNLGVEYTRLIFNLIKKTIYPVIFIIVLYMIYPTASSITSDTILNFLKNVQSIQIGNLLITYKEGRSERATQIAKLNQEIVEIKKINNLYKNRIEKVEEKVYKSDPTKQQTFKDELEKIYSTSLSKYTILVFHRNTSKPLSNLITEKLLTEGYKSSNTNTDFSELKPIVPKDNKIYITYNSHGKTILKDIKKMIKGVVKKADYSSITFSDDSVNLKNGDIQISVF